MSDYISELKKDLLYLLDKLIKQKVIDQSLNKINNIYLWKLGGLPSLYILYIPIGVAGVILRRV